MRKLPIPSKVLIGALVFAGCAAEDSPWVFPEVVASSKYIDYGAFADVSHVCMDDKLAAWDAYIEDISAHLGIDPPQKRIRYSWVPEGETRSVASWPCGTWPGCMRGGTENYQALVFHREVELLHEFVHAVEIPALGGPHRILGEGMAEYLSDGSSTEGVLLDFAAEFVNLIDRGPLSQLDYSLTMHFVGSLIERDGFEKYLEFRDLVDPDAAWTDFQSAYQEVYDADLSDALAEMELTPIQGRGRPWGCDSELTGLPWSTPERLEATLRGECGDGGFYSGGLVEGAPEASKFFTLDVENRGVYKITVQAADGGPTEAVVQISSCPTVRYDDVVVSYPEHQEILWSGRHQVRVDYPTAAAATSGVRLGLEYIIIADPEGDS